MIGNDWDDILKEEYQKPYFKDMMRWLHEEYKYKEIYPPEDQIFSAFHHTTFKDTRVVIIGQDPYIGPGQAHGMSFSVNPGIRIPPSLLNIYKELQRDLKCYIPDNGYLVKWADQGVLLLNSVLTVERGISNSHKDIGWEIFTNKVIESLNKCNRSLVFMLWGRKAREKASLIDRDSHLILESVHPSPLAGNGFIGCGHFSRCNQFLYEIYPTTIDWQICNIGGKNNG